MSDIQAITDAILKFRDDRDWKQYHNLKDIAISLNVEAGELLELFLWKQADEADHQAIRDELADVIYNAFLLAAELEVDVKEIVMEKMKKNEAKYPVDKAKGKRDKYTEL